MDVLVAVIAFLLGGAVVALAFMCMKQEHREQVVYTVGSALHKLNPELMTRGRAEGESFQGNGVVVRIALTGGPCGGKSSSLPHIIKTGKAGGFDVYTAPSIHTLMQNCGSLIPEDEEAKYNWWLAAAQLQLRMEASLVSVARETRRASIVIFDSGIMDVKARVSQSKWFELLRELHPERADDRPEDIEKSVLAQYEAVFHLVSSADGAEQFFKQPPSDQHRTLVDSVGSARDLDNRVWEAWSDHTRHVKVANAGAAFNTKLKKVAHEVLEVAQECLAPPVEAGLSKALLPEDALLA